MARSGGASFRVLKHARLTARTGRYRIYPIAGSACAVGACFLLSRMHAGTPHLVVSPFMVLLGFALSWFLQGIPLRETVGPPVDGIEEAGA